MRKPKRWTALVCVLVLLGVPGCNDATTGGMMGDGGISLTQAAAEFDAAVTDVVLPLLNFFGLFAQLSAQFPLTGQLPRGGCDPAVTCSGGGTYQICPTMINFNMCDEGAVIDGSPGVSLLDPVTGAVLISVTVDNTILQGDGNIVPLATCGPQFTFGAFGVTPPGQGLADITGALEQCQGTFPMGTINMTVFTTVGLSIEVTFDGSPNVTADVTDLATDMLAATCSATLAPTVSAISCSRPAR